MEGRSPPDGVSTQIFDMAPAEAIDMAIDHILVDDASGCAVGLRQPIRAHLGAYKRRLRQSPHSHGKLNHRSVPVNTR